MFLKNFKKFLFAVVLLIVSFIAVGCGKKIDYAEILEEAKSKIMLSGEITNLTGDLSLPVNVVVNVEGEDIEIAIVWTATQSSFFSIGEVDTEGKLTASVTRPAAGEPQAEVTLTATLQYGEESTTREWTVYVRPMPSATVVNVLGAKNSSIGEVLEITGTVTYKISAGFMIHDETGGIYVYSSSVPSGVVPGAVVKVTGNRAVYYSMPQISSPAVEVLTPAPTTGYDFTSAPESTLQQVVGLSSANVASYAKMVKVTGLVEKNVNATYAEYSLRDIIDDDIIYIYNSSNNEVKTELNDKVGKYVSMVVITYDFHSTQLIWRNLGVPGTVEEVSTPVLTDEQIMTKSKAQITSLYNEKEFAADLNLITTTSTGGTVVWASDKPNVIAADGKLTAQAEDTVVTLTASITAGALEEDLEVTVTVKALSTSTVKQVLDAIDAANADGNVVPLVKMVGVVIGTDLDGYYYLADETGTVYVRHKVGDDSLKIGDRVQVVGTGLVFNNNNKQYTRQINGNYAVTVLDQDTHESPLAPVDANITDFDFTITAEELKTKVPQQALLGKILSLNVYITRQGQYNNVYLTTSLEDGAPKMLVYHKSVNQQQLIDLVGTQAVVTAVLYDYHKDDGWRLFFLGRDGDIVTNLTNEQKVEIAEKEIEAIVKEGDNVSGNLNFIGETTKSLISGAKYVWTTDKLDVIDAEGVFAVPAADTQVKITVSVFLDGDVTGTADETWDINVTAKAAAQEVLKFHFDYGTTTVFGYDPAGKDITLTNLAGGEFIAKYYNAQLGSSTYDPHKEAGVFSVLGIHRGGSDAAIEMNFDTSVSKIEFDFTWWSPADSNNGASIGVLALQVWNETTSTWDTLRDFKADLDNSTYKTLSIDVTAGTKFRFFGAAVAETAATNNLRIAIDNVKVYG